MRGAAFLAMFAVDGHPGFAFALPRSPYNTKFTAVIFLVFTAFAETVYSVVVLITITVPVTLISIISEHGHVDHLWRVVLFCHSRENRST